MFSSRGKSGLGEEDGGETEEDTARKKYEKEEAGEIYSGGVESILGSADFSAIAFDSSS